MTEEHSYDVALSFAGEERDYVDRVANLLQERGIKVFYDLFEEADLWGKDLYVHLTDVYSKRAKFTIMFISEAYASKLWTNHERKAAQARAFQESQEYILPARFDETEIPGDLRTVGYLSLKDRSPEDLVSVITKKIVSSGGSIPTALVRKDFSAMAVIQAGEPTEFTVSVTDDEGNPLNDCSITIQADNGTVRTMVTDPTGASKFHLKVRRTSTVLVANRNFPAAVYENVDPNGEMKIVLTRADNIGSIRIERTGHIPDIKGRINTISDAQGRSYIYADNIAIQDGVEQPYQFAINEPFKLEDCDGNIVYIAIKHIRASIALLQYTRKG